MTAGGERRRVRSSLDVVRLVVGVMLVAGGVVLANLFDSALLGLADDTGANIDRLPPWSRDVAAAALASLIIAGAASIAVWSLLTTRYRRFLMLTGAVAAAAALSIVVGWMIDRVVDDAVRAAFEVDVPLFRVGGRAGRLSPADPLLAVGVAAVGVAGSFIEYRLARRAGWVVATYAIVSVLTTGVPALALMGDVGAGLVAASAVLLAVGRHDLALDAADIEIALNSAGVDVVDLQRRLTRSRDGWVACTPDGDRLFVAAFSRDDRSTDLVNRLVRRLRVKNAVSHRPYSSLRRSVEHEALVWQQAAARGLRAPTIVAVAAAGIDGMVLARDWIDGDNARSLAERSRLGTDTVRALWREAAVLQTARISHGELNLGNVVVDDDGQPWLVRFGRSELAAPDQRLGTDVAELLASTATVLGPSAAIELARSELGPDALRRALPWLQPLALTRETRDATADGGFERLREEAAEACGLEPDEPVRLERVNTTGLFILATIVLSAWFLVPQLADLDSLWSQAKDGSLSWALVAVVFSALTYVAATASLLGAIPVRLRFAPALAAQIASSFANRVTPAKVGGLATNVRYFQRRGVPTAVSVTAVGLNAVAGVIVHVLLTMVFLLLASSSESSPGLHLPSPAVVGLGLGSLVVVVGGAMVIPAARRLMSTYVVPQLRSAWASMQAVAHSRIRIALLFGGSAAITLSYLAAMAASLEAFGATASLPSVGLLFLTGTVIANAAPTPGGLGAAEAALIAALSTIEESAVVIPAVFLYRLVTFWLPILPGWIALTSLRRADRI